MTALQTHRAAVSSTYCSSLSQGPLSAFLSKYSAFNCSTESEIQPLSGRGTELVLLGKIFYLRQLEVTSKVQMDYKPFFIRILIWSARGKVLSWAIESTLLGATGLLLQINNSFVSCSLWESIQTTSVLNILYTYFSSSTLGGISIIKYSLQEKKTHFIMFVLRFPKFKYSYFFA